jgi:superoxide reductase
MAKKMEVYKCEVCGNIVEVLHEGEGTLVCCGQDMTLFTANTVDAAREKHVPVIAKVAGGYQVTIGEVAHPMTDSHYIEWIELVAGAMVYRRNLQPGDAPEAVFTIAAAEVTARAYCNLHGLWSK